MIGLHWSPRARANFLEIFFFLENENPPSANKFALNISTRLNNLRQFPLMGRMVPEYEDPTLRELLWKSFRIVYQYRQENLIELVAIVPSRRKLTI